MKNCKKCDAQKELVEFYKNDSTCKECRKEMVRANRASKVDYYREYDRRRFKDDPRVKERIKRYQNTEAGKLSIKNSKIKYIEQNPVKRAAHVILGNAVKNGKIVKPAHCSGCGCTGRIHGHHDDYSQPLVVRWLCPPCHKKWHDENGEAANG